MKKIDSLKSNEDREQHLLTLRAIKHGWKPTQKAAKKMVWHAKRSK